MPFLLKCIAKSALFTKGHLVRLPRNAWQAKKEGEAKAVASAAERQRTQRAIVRDSFVCLFFVVLFVFVCFLFVFRCFLFVFGCFCLFFVVFCLFLVVFCLFLFVLFFPQTVLALEGFLLIFVIAWRSPRILALAAQLAPVGFRWCSWLQLTSVGPSWVQLAAVGRSWVQLAAVGRSRLQLASVGRNWRAPSMDNSNFSPCCVRYARKIVVRCAC